MNTSPAAHNGFRYFNNSVYFTVFELGLFE